MFKTTRQFGINETENKFCRKLLNGTLQIGSGYIRKNKKRERRQRDFDFPASFMHSDFKSVKFRFYRRPSVICNKIKLRSNLESRIWRPAVEYFKLI